MEVRLLSPWPKIRQQLFLIRILFNKFQMSKQLNLRQPEEGQRKRKRSKKKLRNMQMLRKWKIYNSCIKMFANSSSQNHLQITQSITVRRLPSTSMLLSMNSFKRSKMKRRRSTVNLEKTKTALFACVNSMKTQKRCLKKRSKKCMRNR